MDPRTVFWPNMVCPARGKTGKGNISIHSQKEARYKCWVCKKTFTESRGTPFYRLRHSMDLVTCVVTLIAYGCPVQAIVMAFSLDERTVMDWQKRAGKHTEQEHEQLVEQPRELVHVQPMKSGSKRKARCCGWQWRSWSARGCGWEAR